MVERLSPSTMLATTLALACATAVGLAGVRYADRLSPAPAEPPGATTAPAAPNRATAAPAEPARTRAGPVGRAAPRVVNVGEPLRTRAGPPSGRASLGRFGHPWEQSIEGVRVSQDYVDPIGDPLPAGVVLPEDPPPPPVVVSDLLVEEIGPHAAVVRFTTDHAVPGVVGFGMSELVSYAADEARLEHRIELEGLVPDTDYVLAAVSHTAGERPVLEFTTEPARPTPDATISDGRIELDGRPFFPVTAYGACPSTIDALLDAGVNVFQWEHSCGGAEIHLRSSIETLSDLGYWTLPWEERRLAGDGLIGYTQPDEPDGWGLSPSALSDIDEPDVVTFLTLTQHFAPGTGELPWQYPGYYEALAAKADVLGVDFYPLQSLCRPETLALNHDVQAELLRLAEGKPTFQWIEAAAMKCPERADTAITPQTIRAEILLAIAGGANGLGVFPARIDRRAASAFRMTLETVYEAWPLLMTERLPVEIAGEDAGRVRASARVAGGATLVVVANADPTSSAAVELRVDGLEPDQRFVSVDRPLDIGHEEGVVHLELAPLEAHVLVAPPSGLGLSPAPEDDPEPIDPQRECELAPPRRAEPCELFLRRTR